MITAAELLATAPPQTTPLSQAIRDLAADPNDPVLLAGVSASVQTLNGGVYRWTSKCGDADLNRKHKARLVAALHAIADALEQEELGGTP